MKRAKVSGIYSITNLANGKRYVGSAVDIHNRWSVHEANLRGGDHHSYKLQRAWSKYGESCFLFETLELCLPELLVLREQHWIDQHSSCLKGYNVNPKAESALGKTHTAATLTKMSVSARRVSNTPEQKALRSERAKRQHREKAFGRRTWREGSAERVHSSTSRKAKLQEAAVCRYSTDAAFRERFKAGTRAYMATLDSAEFSRRARCQLVGVKKALWEAKSAAQKAEHGRRISEGMRKARQLRELADGWIHESVCRGRTT